MKVTSHWFLGVYSLVILFVFLLMCLGFGCKRKPNTLSMHGMWLLLLIPSLVLSRNT